VNFVNLNFDGRPVDMNSSASNYFDSFPRELWIAILKQIPYPRILRYAKVNSSWLEMVYGSLTYLKDGKSAWITSEILQRCVALKSLRMTCCRFPGVIDTKLAGLCTLTHLQLPKNCEDVSNDALKRLTNLTRLDLNRVCCISDEGLTTLTNLTYLDIRHTDSVTDAGISGLTKLASLLATDNPMISLPVLKKLPNLTCLRIIEKYDAEMEKTMSSNTDLFEITTLAELCFYGNWAQRRLNNNISRLTNLTSLRLSCVTSISDSGIRGLVNISRLSLDSSGGISNFGVIGLTRLTSLDLSLNSAVNDEGIRGLTSLTSLNLWMNSAITDDGIRDLLQLTHLDLRSNQFITNDGISSLTRLSSLNLTSNKSITDCGITGLTRLTSLSLCGNHTITCDGIQGLTNLIFLDVRADFDVYFDISTESAITSDMIQKLPRSLRKVKLTVDGDDKTVYFDKWS
jgi:hypothetical protein